MTMDAQRTDSPSVEARRAGGPATAFFDVDGTLLSFKTHEVPASTQRALDAMRQRGIKLFVATGRAFRMLPDAVNHGFDGYVTVNGQVCFDDAGEFRRQHIDPAGVRIVVDQVRAGLYEALFMTEDRSFISGRSQRVRDNEAHVKLEYELGTLEEALSSTVMQMCAFVGPEDEHVVSDANPYIHTARWCDDFCDVMPVGSTTVSVKGVDRSMSESTVYLTATTAEGGEPSYTVTLARDGISWKVTGVTPEYASQSSSDTTSRVSLSSPLRILFILTASARAYLLVRKRSPTMETIILAYG